MFESSHRAAHPVGEADSFGFRTYVSRWQPVWVAQTVELRGTGPGTHAAAHRCGRSRVRPQIGERLRSLMRPVGPPV